MKLQGVTPQIPSIQPRIFFKPQFVGNAAVLAIPFYEGNGNPTLPTFNIGPENWWLEDYFPFGMASFQGLC